MNFVNMGRFIKDYLLIVGRCDTRLINNKLFNIYPKLIDGIIEVKKTKKLYLEIK